MNGTERAHFPKTSAMTLEIFDLAKYQISAFLLTPLSSHIGLNTFE